MDIFNRPPTIAEDTLQYAIHPSPSFSDKPAVTALATIIDSHVSSLLPKHIWHRDAFEVKVVEQPQKRNTCIIEGHMRVGDCVDDEWCVVWLLRDISERWDVVVSVFDSDGEFLLIEAAEHLPAWITPSNSYNRVWIYSGRLHIVPLQYVSSFNTERERRVPTGGESDDEDGENDSSDYLSMVDAIELVRNAKVDTLAALDIEQAAFRKTEGYPEVASQHLHRTKAYIPSDIALALSTHPALVQKATEAFYTRDALQLRAVTRMSRFLPGSAILTTVAMTRTAYAQLMGQRFLPPKVFGPWSAKEDTPEWKWRDIGMKIACGFEIVYQETKGGKNALVEGVHGSETVVKAHKEALSRDPEYIKYIKNLRKAEFFKGEIEGSAVYQDRENLAVAKYIYARQVDNASRTSFASLVNSAISQAWTQGNNDNIYGSANGEEDPDDWLSVNETTLESMLSERPQASRTPHKRSDIDVDMEGQTLPPEDGEETEQAGQLRNLANKVEQFIQGEGDIDGATFEDDLLSDDAEMSELSDSDESQSQAQKDVVDTLARQTAMDNLVPALKPAEYGTMPASFHSNSQRVQENTLASQTAPTEEPTKRDFNPHSKPIRPLVFPRDQFDGVVDSDDESEEERGADEAEDDEEDCPQIVGEFEVDMQEEEEEFLQFSRDTLGISPEMWNDIVQDRKGRGAFLPDSVLREEPAQIRPTHSPTAPLGRRAGSGPGNSDSGSANPNLDSFESVMQAMDAALSRAKQDKQNVIAETNSTLLQETTKNKGKQRANDTDEGMDMDAAMDAELRAALQDSSDDEDQRDETPMDYTLMKNFLESFKSQQGLSGPVSNLVGRLGWQLPRDES
ncbi:SGT1-domain-containing protein [Ramaria rubella]|nr:SGT1-domain-containing protein [Ramaria rubella]